MLYLDTYILMDHIQKYEVIHSSTIHLPSFELHKLNKNISFVNCNFSVESIFIHNIDSNISIKFDNCSFHGQIEITNCRLNVLSFKNINTLAELHINGNFQREVKINDFTFINENKMTETPLQMKVQIENCDFKSFDFFNVNHTGPYFIFKHNVLGNKEVQNLNTKSSFQNLWVTNAIFEDNFFNEKTYFFRSIFIPKAEYFNSSIYNVNSFSENTFSDVSFENTNFYDYANFNNCNFEGVANFQNINNYGSGDLCFYNCSFNDHSNFESGRVNLLSFNICHFDQSVSFSDTTLQKILLKRNLFSKTVHFDNIIIKNVSECERSTLRTIKQELQRTDNKIDYNRFRSYELSAYYQELQWNWKDGKDKFILGTTKIVTGFDHSWRRALLFSLATGFLFYSLFFISENYFYDFDITGWKRYLSGYFRFLLVTDFYSPLENGRTYIHNSNTIGWFIFILGKIVIAFGIYEMIQAFRKFKA